MISILTNEHQQGHLHEYRQLAGAIAKTAASGLDELARTGILAMVGPARRSARYVLKRKQDPNRPNEVRRGRPRISRIGHRGAVRAESSMNQMAHLEGLANPAESGTRSRTGFAASRRDFLSRLPLLPARYARGIRSRSAHTPLTLKATPAW